jgi:hypothetical protein
VKVLVCGGRDYDNEEHVWEVLDLQCKLSPITLIIQGGARGADTLARLWADARRVDCLTVPADWNKYGAAAGPMRNARMLTYKPDLVIAFPGGRGTAGMVKLANEAGVMVSNLMRGHSF